MAPESWSPVPINFDGPYNCEALGAAIRQRLECEREIHLTVPNNTHDMLYFLEISERLSVFYKHKLCRGLFSSLYAPYYIYMRIIGEGTGIIGGRDLKVYSNGYRSPLISRPYHWTELAGLCKGTDTFALRHTRIRTIQPHPRKVASIIMHTAP